MFTFPNDAFRHASMRAVVHSRLRCMRRVFALGLVAFASLCVTSSTASAQQLEESTETKPTVVDIGLRLIDVTKIDSREETFTVEGILYLEWEDPSQAGNGGGWSEAAVDDRLKELDWWPAPEFENGRGKRERSMMLLSIDEEGFIEYEERFALTMGSKLDLRQFPFDAQNLPIRIFLGGDSVDWARLKVSEFSFGSVRLPEWQFTDNSFEATIEERIIPYGAQPEDSPEFDRALFSIQIQRRWGFYFWRIILPLLIITSVSWAAFWMKREDLGSRLGVSFTALLTVVAFNLIVADALPRIAYLTFLDALITLTYLWLGVTIIVSVTVSQIASAKAQKTDSIAKWLVPSSYYLACLVIFTLWA